jgi:hypothetical protein
MKERNMKNLFLSARLLAVLTALVFAACNNPAGSGSNNNGSGSNNNDSNGDPTTSVDGVTFSDGVPPGAWVLYITPSPVSSKEAALAVGGDYVAAASSSSVSGNKTLLAEVPGRSFDRNGIYNMVLILNGTTVKYASSVKFTNGNATVVFNTLISL